LYRLARLTDRNPLRQHKDGRGTARSSRTRVPSNGRGLYSAAADCQTTTALRGEPDRLMAGTLRRV